MLRSINVMWVATVLWAVAALVAIIDGEVAQSLGWIAFVVAAVLTATGATDRDRNLWYLSMGLLVVGVVIFIGDFVSS